MSDTVGVREAEGCVQTSSNLLVSVTGNVLKLINKKRNVSRCGIPYRYKYRLCRRPVVLSI
jgi:hypothetical protein